MLSFLPLLAVTVATAEPPTAEQVETWIGAQVVGTSTAQGQAIGPAALLFDEPELCQVVGKLVHADAGMTEALQVEVEALRQGLDLETLPVKVQSTTSSIFRLDLEGERLWLRVSEPTPHALPLPTLYAHGQLRSCLMHKALDLRFEHGGLHWQIEGPCSVGYDRTATLIRHIDEQIHPTWLAIAPCGSFTILPQPYLAEAGLEGHAVLEALRAVKPEPKPEASSD
jgi:hypothetical protein